MNKRKSFGIAKELERGITETISTTKNNIGQLRYEIIPLSRVKLDPNNPRELSISLEDVKNGIENQERTKLSVKQVEELEKLLTLAHSIKKFGVRHAIEVYKDGNDYRVISGERRVLASYLAKKTDIQARILEHKPAEADLKLLQWIENIERADLSLWERINNVIQLNSAYVRQHSEALTSQKLTDILGCSRWHSANLLVVANADDKILEPLRCGKIQNLEKIALVARVEDEGLKSSLLESCIAGMSLEQLKGMLNLNSKSHVQRLIKKGRNKSYVNLGRSNNIGVIKYLVDLVLHTEKYSKYDNLFTKIDWSKTENVANAFKSLLKIIDQNESEAKK